MTDAVETMAYAGQVPWHGFGNAVHNRMSPEEMCVAGGIPWEVEKQAILLKSTGQEIPGEYALVRKTDNRVLSIVGAKYKPTQNIEAMDFFTKFVKEGNMEMETVGSLWEGRYVWGLAKVNKNFKVGKNDEVRGYVLLASPHFLGKALLLMHTAIRVVCWNTYTQALGAGGATFRMPHTLHFNDQAKQKAAETLGLAVKQTEIFRDSALFLSKKQITQQVAEQFFCEVLKFDPEKAKKKKDGEIIVPQMLPKFREALETSPGHDLAGSRGTLWGAFNAVTFVIDHSTGRNGASTALKNAWLGNLANVKREALEIALDYAKK